MKKPLIVIAGPTASGKTSLSVALAKRINGEIISADSMQVYKYMDIGSAKVTEDEKQGIPHYLVDELYPDEEFNINIFQDMAKKAMENIYNKNKVPILVGGTGFYIQSIVNDINFTETCSDTTIREELELFAKEEGAIALHNMLKEIDPISYETIHPNNVKRVIRAIEYYRLTDSPISTHNAIESQKESPYNVLFYVLNMDRELLYNRINQRVDLMVENGLINEVERLIELGYSRDLVSMQGLSYKEIYDYKLGKYSLEEAIYMIKRDTRHFAKRQLTWFRREEQAKWLNVDDYQFDINKIVDHIYRDCEEINII